jgi:hypothetical protein
MDTAEPNRRIEKITAPKEAELRNRIKKEVMRQSRQEIDNLQERLAKQRAQHAREKAQMQAKLEEIRRKFEHQTSEQKGEEGEMEVYDALKKAFPTDDIQRIAKGVRGADILQRVMTNGKEVGCLVYECKNATSWQNEWITKAKQYRLEYRTPWVIIATRTFPHRQEWFTVEHSVPIIDLRLTAELAKIIRGAIIEIGKLRASTAGRQAKADQMFKYILSDHFTNRFKGVAEAVATLREHQRKEKQWHNKSWEKQTRLYDNMEQMHSDIEARIYALSQTPPTPPFKVASLSDQPGTSQRPA